MTAVTWYQDTVVEDDASLLRAFEDGTLPKERFGHREHVRLAFLCVRGVDFGEGAVRFRRALRRFVDVHGLGARYHETLTWAYLALVAEAITAEDETSHDLLRRRADLLDHRSGALASVYDVAAITADDRARRVLVLPRRSAS